MNSTHPFYPILIPDTSYVKNFILFVEGPRKDLVSKKCCTPSYTKFFTFFLLHRGIRKKILHKITNFEVWVF